MTEVEQELSELRTRMQNAETIFMRWYRNGMVSVEDVFRVLRGDYNYAVTFLKRMPSKGVPSANGYVVITDADSLEEAEQIAERMYGGAVDTVTVEWRFRPSNYKYGEMNRHKAKVRVTT